MERSSESTQRDVIRLFPSLLLCGLLAVLALGGLGCASMGGSSGPVLRVGISPDYPPVAFEREGEIVGIEADLASIMASRLGRRLRFERYAFEDLIGALEQGEIDVVMSGMSITPEREDRIRFTETYMEVGQLTLIRTSDIARFGRPQSIRRAGARVGYERGTTGEEFVAARLGRADSFGFDDIDSGIRSLRANRIDYFVHDAPTIWRMAGDPSHRDLHGLYKPLTREYLAWAVHRNDGVLLTQLNATLADLKREGLIEPVVDRWIPVRITIP
ncbi:MAG: transporter substrate-binding domain-containing protein [Myxococcota bacterium]